MRLAQSNTFHESEMALCSEPTDQSAQKVLDGADIVRDAMLRQLWEGSVLNRSHFLGQNHQSGDDKRNEYNELKHQ